MPTLTLDSATTLHYDERGTGNKMIVLLHAFPLDNRIWNNILREVPPGLHLILPDMTGFGESNSDRPFSIESLADDVQQLLVKLDVCPIVLGGISMGGYVALAYAKKYPMDLKGLILIDTRAEGDTVEGKGKRQKMIELCQKSGAGAGRAVADQMMPNMIAKDHASDQKLVASVRQIMESCPPRTIEHACMAMRDRPDQTEFLPSIAFPTLIIVGDQDVITPKSASEAMKNAIPQSKLVVIPGSGHLSPMEKPGEVSSAIIDFVKTL